MNAILIGGKIQEFRQKHGLTQEGLAEKLDVSRQSVSKWELGKICLMWKKLLPCADFLA